MKPGPFEYNAPGTLDEALGLLREHGFDAKLLAGGQSLVPLMNFRLAQPALLVDLNPVAGLDLVRRPGAGGLEIGAMTRVGRLEREPVVAEEAPLLAEALPWIAHPQIRNRGTVGGSLAHADPAAELPAVAVALDFTFRLVKAGGERAVAAADFYRGLMTTDMAPDEILVAIEIPPTPPGTGTAFEEVARRRGDYAQVGVAARLTLDGSGRCSDAKLVFLSVGDTPVDASVAANGLIGEELSDPDRATPILERAASHAAEHEIEPGDDLHASAAFKRHLARILTTRALERARERALKRRGEAT